MKKNRLWAASLIVTMCSSLMFGCSSSDDEKTTTTEAPTTQKNVEEETTPTVEELNYEICKRKDNFNTGSYGVHDPSIVKEGDTYYIFGSHMAWAKSTDLVKWERITNNINIDYKTIFKDAFEWAAIGDSVYDPAGNMWAPDVIWNPQMNKWCMYMSINGYSWNSSIVMLTADSLEGDWTLQGTVVYSGMTNPEYEHDFAFTDFTKVTGETTLPERYIREPRQWMDNKTPTNPSTWHNGYGAHAIDPCVFYDTEGKLYMTYGSWSGGIWILELDEATGLRDYNVKYTFENAVSDPYMGIKLTGGNQASGEGPYVMYDEESGYYYLFVSYGGLVSNGGYNMRLFRSKNPTGPYTDATEKDGKLSATETKNEQLGVKLLGGYDFPILKNGYLSPGHNSAFIDDDGKMYVIYHTRFENSGEMHCPRVHQLFKNEKDWLCITPFQYQGETISETGYEKTALAGTYYVVTQSTANNTTSAAYKEVQLNEDGTVSGEMTGTWSYTDGTYYMQIKIGNVQYYGVFVEMTDEAGNNCMCFSAVGDGSNFTLIAVKYN